MGRYRFMNKTITIQAIQVHPVFKKAKDQVLYHPERPSNIDNLLNGKATQPLIM